MESYSDAVIRKRLHIAGLTQSVSASDLSQRLGTFGKVVTVDGVGALDGLGRPRPFAYVTIEAKKSQLARCMNLLSGTTWKGAKLRIGEAKPDFRERIKRENEAPPDDRQTKRRRLERGIEGVHASEMSLVTPENVSSRPGWRVTPMGRIVHPIRMRPEKPLPPTSAVTSSTIGKKVEQKRRKVERAKLVRARRKTIDPTKWDSQHLKGAFLNSIVVADTDDRDDLPVTKHSQLQPPGDQEEPGSSSGEEEDEEVDGSDSFGHETAAGESQPGPGTTSRLPPATRIECDAVDTDLDSNREKLHSLSLLDSMFGNLEMDQEWGGKEALDSDIDIPDLPPRQSSPEPRSSLLRGSPKGPDLALVVEGVQEDSESEESSTRIPTPPQERVPASGTIRDGSTTKGKLKDLFTPQEDQGFSLVNQLDLDLELDDEEPFPPALLPPVPSVAIQSSTPISSFTTRVSSTHAQTTFDATQPLFFPVSKEKRANEQRNAKLKDIFDVFKEKGLDPQSTGFYRTERNDEIMKRWEDVKGDLTRDWKRRHREAVKSRRRRGGADGD